MGASTRLIQASLWGFAPGSEGLPVPIRLDADRMATCIFEAKEICEDAKRKAECNPGILMATVASLEASRPYYHDLPTFNRTERKVPPNLHAAVLSFSARLLKYVNEKCNGDAPVAYKLSGVSRQVYSRIVSDNDSLVDKRTAMLFCIGLKLSMDEAQLLLKSAGHAFSDTIPEDCLFRYCIEKGIWNLEDVNEVFVQCGLQPVVRLKTLYR